MVSPIKWCCCTPYAFVVQFLTKSHKMNPKSMFLRLPDVVAFGMLHFVCLNDLVKLDSSFCNVFERNIFMAHLEFNHFVLKGVVNMTSKCFRWLLNKSVKFEIMRFHGDIDFRFHFTSVKHNIFSKVHTVIIHRISNFEIDLVQTLFYCPCLIEFCVEEASIAGDLFFSKMRRQKKNDRKPRETFEVLKNCQTAWFCRFR